MFDLRITTLPEATDLLRQGWPAKAVSLICPGTPGFACHGPHHLLVHVHDIAEDLEGHVVPCRQHLLNVLDFTADLPPGSRLLVHCIAGISRSTSMAIGILIARGVPWRAAWDMVAAVRPCMMPNARIIRLIDEHYGLGGELSAQLRAWRARTELTAG
ncbi:MAG: dual specificity protein phosphatase family protein [Acetobacteraceae bacterium]|nr:dual specificity protein phosphatase family protein [Acetobacteraceae bacterium]